MKVGDVVRYARTHPTLVETMVPEAFDLEGEVVAFSSRLRIWGNPVLVVWDGAAGIGVEGCCTFEATDHLEVIRGQED